VITPFIGIQTLKSNIFYTKLNVWVIIELDLIIDDQKSLETQQKYYLENILK